MRIIHIKRKRALREQIRLLRSSLNHWEKWVNAWLGSSLKNPMCRRRKRPAVYTENNKLTTTG